MKKQLKKCNGKNAEGEYCRVNCARLDYDASQYLGPNHKVGEYNYQTGQQDGCEHYIYAQDNKNRNKAMRK